MIDRENNNNNTIVNDDGFHSCAPFDGLVYDFIPGEDLDQMIANMNQYVLIRIHFDSFADGRGFSLARRLRENGYVGHLRAYGHVIADQYTMARRSGFDDVEISADLAARQDATQWQFRSDWKANDYQSRMRGI